MAFVAAFVRCGIRGFVRAGTRSFVLAPVRGLRSVVHLLLALRVGGAETCAVLNLLFHSTGLSGLHFDVGRPTAALPTRSSTNFEAWVLFGRRGGHWGLILSLRDDVIPNQVQRLECSARIKSGQSQVPLFMTLNKSAYNIWIFAAEAATWHESVS